MGRMEEKLRSTGKDERELAEEQQALFDAIRTSLGVFF